MLGEDHPETVRVRSNLAAVLFQRGDLERTEAVYREILATRRRLLGPDHPDIARTLNSLGTVQEKRGHLAAAQASFQEGLAMCRRLNPPQERMAAVALVGLGSIAHRQGDLKAADEAFTASYELFQRHIGDDPQGFASALRWRVVMLRDRGDRAGAAKRLRQGLERLEEVGGTEVQVRELRGLLADLER